MYRCPCRTECHRTGCIDHFPVWQRCFAAAIADHMAADRVEDESLTAAGRKGSDGVGVTGVCRSLADAVCFRSRFLKGLKYCYGTKLKRKFIRILRKFLVV